MLRKCLKYDLTAVFRIWWIAALTVLGLSVVCGFNVRALILNPKPDELMIVQTMVVVASVLAAAAFGVLSMVLYVVRFYNNFFKDEGYLTFTLPVRRHTLFASKIISALTVQFATGAVITLGVCIVLLMAPFKGDINDYTGMFYFENVTQAPNVLIAMVMEIGIGCAEAIEGIGGFFWIYVLEAVVLMLAGLLLQTVLLHFSITMGATVAKKHKALASVGIYYISNTVVSFVQQIGFFAMAAWTLAGFGARGESFEMEMEQGAGVFRLLAIPALLLVIWILYYAITTTILYYASLGNLERKLNLQ